MTIRNKITLIVIFIWAIFLLLVYFALESILLQSYYELENKQAYDNVERVDNALDEMVNATLNMTASWAVWDDTYQFIQNKNEAYIKSNLTAESIASTDMDLILFYDAQANLFYSAAIDPPGKKIIPLPTGLLDCLSRHSKFIRMKNINDEEKGFLGLQEGLLFIASRPIVTSKNTGPVLGVIIMGKFMNSDMFKTLRNVTQLNLSLHAMNDNLVRKIPIEIKKYLFANKTPYIKRINDRKIIIYSLLRDINGKPIYMLQIDMPRYAYAIGKKAMHYYNYIYILATLLINALLWLFLQTFIVRRIESIHKQFDSFHSRRLMDKLPSSMRKQIRDEVSAVSMLYYQATHDPLTGLANRNLLYQAFQFYTEPKDKPNIGIIFLDMYKFKYVNDTLGHDIGDQLLIAMAKQLMTCLRDNDIAARLGGDEFLLMLIDGDKARVELVIDRIFDALSQPVQISGHELNFNANLGVSLYPQDGQDIATLLKKADIALYKAKESGSNNFAFYTDELNQSLMALRHKEIALQKAYDENQFILYFQPIYSAKTKEVICFEALLRWNHPEKGIVNAEFFITTAEKMGLIIALGKWVLTEVCVQLERWKNLGLKLIPIAVNISSQQAVYGAMDQFIMKTLRIHNVNPKCLEIEITETGFIGFTPKILEDLKNLSLSGIKVSIDDFGIGYSGLGYLRSLPVDKLKIDKSFVQDITNDADARTIVLAIISIAHQLHLEVIAEGVETEEEFQFLLANDVDAVQGYLFSKPLTIEQCEQLLHSLKKNN